MLIKCSGIHPASEVCVNNEGRSHSRKELPRTISRDYSCLLGGDAREEDRQMFSVKNLR